MISKRSNYNFDQYFWSNNAVVVSNFPKSLQAMTMTMPKIVVHGNNGNNLEDANITFQCKKKESPANHEHM